MLKAAIIGLGWWGRHIVNSLETSKKIEVVRLAARRPDRHKQFSNEKGIVLVESYQEVLQDPEVDAVILCTPHTQHENQVLAAVRNQKQIFCEKPLSLTKESVDRMIRTTKEAGIILGVGHERRYEPAMVSIAKSINSGELGTLNACRSKLFPQPFRPNGCQ